jgi:hypothetical protein
VFVLSDAIGANDTPTERGEIMSSKNYVVYNKNTGESISYHKSAELADKAARKIDAALRSVTSKRIK